MAILLLGLVLWGVAHLVPVVAPQRRAAFASVLGEGPYKGLAALALVASVVLMTLGYQGAGVVDLWFPPAWTVHLNNLLMLAAVAFFIAAPFKGTVSRVIRHPQLIGFKTWALAHLAVNGDLASVVLFGGLLGWAVFSVIRINKRDGARVKPPAGPRIRDLAHAGATLAVFLVVAGVHNWLGVWPFPG